MKPARPNSERSGSPGGGPLSASIIIDNYNYGHFLADAIDSALAQTYPHIEVIVVDDGSTDNSRDIVSSYGDRIRFIFKENGGQASALNAGFSASRGDVIFFLDSDDLLSPQSVATVVPYFEDPTVSKLHWPMWVIRSDGSRTDETRPPNAPPAGDFRQQVLARGPSNVASSPTSGNAWSRRFLDRVMPIPEDLVYYRTCADEYLYTLAPVFGWVQALESPQGSYRTHANSIYSSRPFAAQLKMELHGYAEQCKAMEATLARSGISVDTRLWMSHSWFHRLDQALTQMAEAIPAGCRVAFVDGGSWGNGWHSNRWQVSGFNDRAGIDWGPPEDGHAAIECLRAIIDQGIQHLVFAWPAFWWFDEYPELFDALTTRASLVTSDDSIRVYRLKQAIEYRDQTSGRHTFAAWGGGDHA